MMAEQQPQTLRHTFKNSFLQNHYIKNAPSPGACKLIDLPGDVFLDTEEELNVISAILWIMGVDYDNLDDEIKPKNQDELRSWILFERKLVMGRVLDKIEPPFHAWTVDQMQRDIAGMMEDLLLKVLPRPEPKKAADKKK